MKKPYVIVTGGMGFIGSAVVEKLLSLNFKVINIDKLSYAANLDRVKEFKNFKNHYFYKLDITKLNKLSLYSIDTSQICIKFGCGKSCR